jgi:hypothetical protein
MAEGANYIPVPGTTSVRGDPREVWLCAGQPGRVVITVYAGKKPIEVVVPIGELRKRLEQVEQR